MNTDINWVHDPKRAEVCLSYRSKPETLNNPSLTCPQDAYGYLCDVWNQDRLELQEEFLVVLMNHSKQVMSWSKISVGGRCATVVEVPSIVQLALLGNASSVILAHNHPSNLMKPSSADINLTNRVKKALRLFNIGLDDHIILTATGYVSFADRGLLSKSFSSDG